MGNEATNGERAARSLEAPVGLAALVAVDSSWQCIGHEPTRWGLGKVEKGFMHPVIIVERQRDGFWHVVFQGVWILTESSRTLAMEAAEDYLEEANQSFRSERND